MSDLYKALLTGIIGIAGLMACSSEVSNRDIKIPSQKLILDNKQIKIRADMILALEEYANADLKSGYKGYYAQSLSMAGRADIPFFDKVLKDPRNICKVVDNQNFDEPIKSLMSAVKEHTLVIINEDHKMPRDRAFILEFLKALRAEGFTHYAAETFQENITNSDPKFSVSGDGYYSNEPIYGRLLTYVKQAGFKLVAYEQTDIQRAPEGATMDERINYRENAQRDNLIATVLEANPSTKMVIHVGHSHVAEIPIKRRNSNNGTKWMAARLKEKTDINPLTISQTACRSTTVSSVVSSDVHKEDNTTVTTYTDYAIGHAPLTFSKKRPNWRRTMGDMEVAIPSSFTSFAEPVLIEARPEKLPDSTVPVDRVLIREGEGEIPLLLPSGSYRIEAFNKEGRLGDIEYLTVSEPE